MRSDVRARLLQITPQKLRSPEINEWLNIAVENLAMELGNVVDLYYGQRELVDTTDASHLYASATLNIIRLRSESKKAYSLTGTDVTYNHSSKSILCSGSSFVDDEWNNALVMFGDNNDIYMANVSDTVNASESLILDVDIRGSALAGATANWVVVVFPEIDFEGKMKLVDATNGIVPFVDEDGFESLGDIDLYDSEVAASLFGPNEIHLFKGTDVTAYGTFTLWYRRKPIRMVVDNQPMDMPSKYKDLVVRKTMLIGLQKLGQFQEMGNIQAKLQEQLTKIRSSFAEEKATIKERLQPKE